MQFKFIGTEPSDFFGFSWYPGTVHDVADDHAIRKLSNSVLFEAVGTAPTPVETPPSDDVATPEEKEPFDDYVQQPKRRGRPPKVTDGNQN